MDTSLRLLLFSIGFIVVVATVASAIRTFVVPRSDNVWLTRAVFLVMWQLYRLPVHRARSYEDVDRIMASYAPFSLLVMPAVWLVCVLAGYMSMFRALGVPSWSESFAVSGSSLLTLGFARLDTLPQTALAFSEAAIGLTLVALLISYLPTMYAAFSRREALVSLLDVRAGTPPSAAEMIMRLHRNRGLDTLTEIWERWEVWFADVEESHTSLAALVFFRSPQPQRSWVSAAGVVLDTAAIVDSTVSVPTDVAARLCIRAGYLALRQIADFFRIAYNPNPTPGDPISVTREEYDAVYDQLASAGVPLKKDREQAWHDFAGWRVNYDAVLLELAALTLAPYTPWVSDRSRPR